MLIAHMDTVYAKGILATEPYRQDGNKLYGPGIADDKGGIAVILHSLAILRDAGWKDYARLTVLFNPDEEIGSIGSGELIAALGADARRGAVLRAHRGQGGGQGRRRAADGRRHGHGARWRSRAAPRTPVPRPTRAATR